MGNQAWLGSGWGIAPLYVGEQVVGLNSSLNPSLAKGGTDGAQAAAYMASEGFAAGSCVYLDWEDGSALVQNASDYIGAWCDAVAAAGYQPGVYCSHLLAAGIHQLRSSARIWAFKVSTTQPHPFPGTNFPTLDPSGSGYAGASVWQLGQECQLALPGAPQAALVVDLSVGITADPGAP